MFYTIDQIKRANASAGQHFFEPGAMRFFRSRISHCIYPLDDGGAIIVTSERFITYTPSYCAKPRRYSIRRVEASGSIAHDSGPEWEFQAYTHSASAHRAAKRIADEINAWSTKEV